MMSTPTKQDNHHISACRKTPTSIPKSPEPARCPRCDSPNTKFCYYNNYSLSQPRHFCKSCRRYWTRGGALRSVPIGGGSRKNRKLKHNANYLSSSFSNSSSSRLMMSSSPSGHDRSQDHIGRLGFIDGSVAPPRPDPPELVSANRFINPSPNGFIHDHYDEILNPQLHANLASSIESLSSLNQDLHQRLQQQRLSMFFSVENQKEAVENHSVSTPSPLISNSLRPEINYLNDFSRKVSVVAGASIGEFAKERFSGDYDYGCCDIAASSNSVNWYGVQAWGHELHSHYSELP